MKQLKICSVVSDRKTNEFIQRWIGIDITDEELELLNKFKESVQKRVGKVFPFSPGGFGTADPDKDINLSSPLGAKMKGRTSISGKLKMINRMHVMNHIYVEDEEGNDFGGWMYI